MPLLRVVARAAAVVSTVSTHVPTAPSSPSLCPSPPPSLALCSTQERRLHAEELEANNGVLYRTVLSAVPAPESIAADKGIKRAADKASEPVCLCDCVRNWGWNAAG